MGRSLYLLTYLTDSEDKPCLPECVINLPRTPNSHIYTCIILYIAMQLQRGLSSVLRGAVFNFRQDLHFPPSKSSTAIPKTRTQTIYSDGISKCCCCNSTWCNPSLHVSRNKDHDGVKAARLPEHGHQQNPTNRSCLINPKSSNAIGHLAFIDTSELYSSLFHPHLHSITWSIIGPCHPPSHCNFRLNFVEMSRRKDMHMPLLQWQHERKAVYKSVPGCAMLWDRNEFGFRDEHCRLQIFIFMQHSPHHPCIYC